MFERFTDLARRVVVLAQEEARALNHDYIGTEHLLLGLVREGEGVAAKALEAQGVRLAAVRAEVEAAIGRGEGMPAGHLPFTPHAKKALELSLREALQLDHNYIGTEHILLGIVREGEGAAAEVLARLGAGPGRVRAQVLDLLRVTSRAGEPAGVVTAMRRRLGEMGPSGRLDQLLGRLDAVERRLARIEELLGPGPAAQQVPAPGAPAPPEPPAGPSAAGPSAAAAPPDPGAPPEPPAGEPPTSA